MTKTEGLDYFKGMSPKEIEDFMEAQDEMNREKAEQYHKDIQVIRAIKKTLPKRLFHFISVALYESSNWTELEIVDNPTGEYQQETKDYRFKIAYLVVGWFCKNNNIKH